MRSASRPCRRDEAQHLEQAVGRDFVVEVRFEGALVFDAAQHAHAVDVELVEAPAARC
jgi:hypothetical protein